MLDTDELELALLRLVLDLRLERASRLHLLALLLTELLDERDLTCVRVCFDAAESRLLLVDEEPFPVAGAGGVWFRAGQ
jgi:hypothetical protein